MLLPNAAGTLYDILMQTQFSVNRVMVLYHAVSFLLALITQQKISIICASKNISLLCDPLSFHKLSVRQLMLRLVKIVYLLQISTSKKQTLKNQNNFSMQMKICIFKFHTICHFLR